MARKSFILHLDSLNVCDDLDSEQTSKLFRAIIHYQRTGEVPDMDQLTRIAFSPFLNQFKRDDANYGKVIEARKKAGSKGGKQKVANASKSKQNLANVAVNDSDSVNDSKNEITEGRRLFDEFWKAYDKPIAQSECEHVWFEMQPEERRKAAQVAPIYVKSLDNRKYQVHPKKWLEEKRWNDNYGDHGSDMVKVINCMTGTPTTIPLADWNRVHANDRNSVYKLAQV